MSLLGPLSSRTSAFLGAIASIASGIGARADGWANAYTGLGTGRDKATAAYYNPLGLLSPQELSTLFHTDDIAYRIITTRPKEMMRAGYRVVCSDVQLAKDLCEDAKKLDVDGQVLKGMILGSLYGGAATVLGVNDYRDPARPIGPKIKSLEWAVTLDKRYLYPAIYYGQDATPSGLGGNYNNPEVYVVTPPLSPMPSQVHESRIIRWDGAMVDDQVRRQLASWSISNLQRAYETMRLFGTSFQAVGHLLQDASQGVYKVKDLLHMIAYNRQDLEDRIALNDMSRSVSRAIIVDAEHEDFTRVSTTFTGLPDVLDRIMMRLSAATEIPVTLLMGRSAAGMNSTGDSDFRAFYASCANEQNTVLKPALERVYRLLAQIRGADPEDVHIAFNPLHELSAAEESLVAKNNADRDCSYINAGVWHSEEVALRLLSGRTEVNETPVDEATLEKSLKIERKLGVDPEVIKANAMPAPPSVGGGKQPKNGVDVPGPRTSKVNEP